jgi:hypothetical protein
LKNPKLANSEVRACCCLQYCANANLSTEYWILVHSVQLEL